MICPKCGAVIPDESRYCNMCQEPLTEEARAEATQKAAAMPAETPKPKKNSKLPLYLALTAIVVVLAVVAAVMGSRNTAEMVTSEPSEVTGEQVTNETGTDALGAYTEAQLEGAVARVQSEGFTLSNVEFNYYYWGQYYYVVSAYGSTISYYFDTTKPLADQMYSDTMTWQDFFVENAISAVIQTKAMVFKAQEEGFELPEESRASLEQTLVELQTYSEQYEYESLDAYIAASYGEGATFESFSAYLEDSYLSSAYTDEIYSQLSFTDDQIEEYYDTYAEEYEAAEVPKDDTHAVDVRHILVAFETDEEGNVSDEANAAAKAEAQQIFDQWQADGATEEAFVALVADNTDDTATASYGGLCSTVCPGDTVEGFDDWLFAEGRQAGDCDIVETVYGWHVVYFVQDDGLLWQIAAESDMLYENTYGAIEQITGEYAFEFDKSAISISTPDDVSAGFVDESEAVDGSETGEDDSAQ